MFSFERLNAGHLIVAHHAFTLPGQLLRPLIMVIDVRYLLRCLLIISRCEPIPNLMRFDIPLFLKDVPRVAPISALLFPVS